MQGFYFLHITNAVSVYPPLLGYHTVFHPFEDIGTCNCSQADAKTPERERPERIFANPYTFTYCTGICMTPVILRHFLPH